MAYPFVRLLLLVGFTETPHSFGDTRFWMHFRIWQTMLPLTALLRLTKLFSPSRTRAIIASKSKTFAMPRKAHKRGHSTHIRGLSQEKVCVPCAVNRNGLSISKITNTGRVSTRDLHHIYDGRIKTNSTLVTDKMNSYVRFTNANGIDLVQLKTGKAKKGIYNIQHINSYHSQLKRFMRGFNGVSTKYLNNYLVWNNLVNYAKESDMEKRNIFLTFVLATLKTAKCRDLSNRPAVPLVA